MKYLFLVLILFLPSQLGKHWWPEWSLVDGVRVDYLSPTVFLTDVVLGALLVSYFLGEKSKIKYQISNIQFKNQKFKKAIIMVLAVLLTIGYWIWAAERRWLAGYWLARYLEVPLVAVLTVKIRRIRRDTHLRLPLAYFANYSFTARGAPIGGQGRIRREIITALAISVLFSVGLGAGQMVLGKTTGWFWWLGERTFTAATPGVATMTIFGREVLRPYATFGHPNALGGFIATATIWLWQMKNEKLKMKNLIVDTNRGISQLGAKALIAIGILGVVLTGSRGAMAGLIIAILLNCYIVSGIRKIKSRGFLGIVGLLVISSLVISYWLGDAKNKIVFANESTAERLVLAQAAGRMWRENWLTGVGPGQFLVRLPDYLPAGFWKIQPGHNVFLLVLAEFGIIGGGIMVITVIKIIRSAVRSQKSEVRESGLKWLPVVAVILVTGMVDHYWLTAQQNRLLLGVILGMMISVLGRRSIFDFCPRLQNK